MKNIVIFGAPGSGKGTQSDKIIEEFGVAHISTGDVLRAEIKAGTELGKTASGYINEGKLVPDSLIIDMLAATLDSKGMMHAVSATPIEKVEYVSFSGEKLKTIVLGGVKEVDVDTRLYPNEYPLVIVFHGEDGSSVSISVTK